MDVSKLGACASLFTCCRSHARLSIVERKVQFIVTKDATPRCKRSHFSDLLSFTARRTDVPPTTLLPCYPPDVIVSIQSSGCPPLPWDVANEKQKITDVSTHRERRSSSAAQHSAELALLHLLAASHHCRRLACGKGLARTSSLSVTPGCRQWF